MNQQHPLLELKPVLADDIAVAQRRHLANQRRELLRARKFNRSYLKIHSYGWIQAVGRLHDFCMDREKTVAPKPARVAQARLLTSLLGAHLPTRSPNGLLRDRRDPAGATA